MTVLHWWFMTAPTGIWHAVTPLSFAKFIAGLLLYAGYGAATLLAAGVVFLGVAKVLGAARRAFAGGYRKGAAD